MSVVERAVRGIDRAQRKNAPAGFVYAVIRKFGDDQAGTLAALLTYYGFLSIFPLLLVMVTVLGILAGGSASIEHRVINSALSDFPVIGDKLVANIHALHRSSPLALTIGLLGLVWGSLGVCSAGQYAMAQVWNIPKVHRPGFLPRLARSTLLLVSAAVFIAASATLVALGVVGGSGLLALVGATVASVILDVALFVGAFRILTPKSVGTKSLLPGAAAAGIAWAALQIIGGILIQHELRHMSDVYGFFAIVLGALWWIYLISEVTLYAAELNVVIERRLWPRGLVQPPFTEADERMLLRYPHVEGRRPEVIIETRFRDAPTHPDGEGDAATPVDGREPVDDIAVSPPRDAARASR
jgi:YihY family inner membrane protein